MNISQKTILITGGGSGIGYEIAKKLSIENKVIIVGRNADRLVRAANSLTNVIALPADITNEEDVNQLVERVNKNYGELSVLINNAGQAFAYKLSDMANAFEKAFLELATNYLAPVRLTERLLPVLKRQSEAAIVNVSSIVALTPGISVPTYSDSKAALHSYTQSLRKALAGESSIKVFELMPPLVDTDFSVEIGGREHGISPVAVAESLINGIRENVYEIHVGRTKDFYDGYFPSAAAAFEAMNG